MALCNNLGSVDRGIRALLGVVALVLALTTPNVMAGSHWGIVAAVVGLVMLGTAAMGVCPLSIPLKLSTCATTSQ